MNSSRANLNALLLDLGGTLILPEPSVAAQYRAAATEAFPGRTLPSESLIRTRFRVAFPRMGPYGKLLRYGTTVSEGFWFWKRMIGIVFPDLGESALQSLTETLYERFRDPAAWRVRSGARSFLNRLRSREVKTALVTNWDRRARELVGALDLEPLFEAVVISSEQGHEKPDPALFGRALEALDVQAREALVVGDSLQTDVKPARRLGMRALYFGEDAPSSDDPWEPSAESWREVADYVTERLQ